VKATNGVRRADPVAAYARVQQPRFRKTCDHLREVIEAALPQAACRVWHGSPVWFIEGNPVVGYYVTAKSVNLLFWNGRAFREPDLEPVGKYTAAQARFTRTESINPGHLRRWLGKARSDVLDSKAIVRASLEIRKGVES